MRQRIETNTRDMMKLNAVHMLWFHESMHRMHTQCNGLYKKQKIINIHTTLGGKGLLYAVKPRHDLLSKPWWKKHFKIFSKPRK